MKISKENLKQTITKSKLPKTIEVFERKIELPYYFKIVQGDDRVKRSISGKIAGSFVSTITVDIDVKSKRLMNIQTTLERFDLQKDQIYFIDEYKVTEDEVFDDISEYITLSITFFKC